MNDTKWKGKKGTTKENEICNFSTANVKPKTDCAITVYGYNKFLIWE
jgi:hypothetical protein